jgi:choline/glycine/proline betaine transport protein
VICCVWFTVFGYVGYVGHIEGLIDFEGLFKTAPFNTLFAVLDQTLFPLIASSLAVLCVIIFYVTSSDSGSYVVDMIASGGKKAPHSYLRIFWSVTEGLLALVLFYYGGVKLIQNLVVLLSLPIIIYLCFGIYKVNEKLSSDG